MISISFFFLLEEAFLSNCSRRININYLKRFLRTILKMVRILMPNGGSTVVCPSKTVEEAIKHCIAESHCQLNDYCDYSLVFFGRKLGPQQLLADVPHLLEDESRAVRMVCRKMPGAGAETSRAEVDKLRSQCRTMYDNLGEELQQKLDTYMADENCAMFNSILKDHPELLHDSVAISIVRDLRLLVPAILENNEFAYERPICAKILKKTLLQFGIMQQRPPDSFMAQGPFGFPGRQAQQLHGRGRGGGGTAPMPTQPVGAPQLITHDMLSEAMNLALGTAATPSAGPSPAATTPSAATAPSSSSAVLGNASPQYAVQLGMLHEYGFTNDVENGQVLAMADGDVEQALQILIAMREDN